MLVNFKVFFEEELTSLLASRLLHTTKEALNAKLGIDIRDGGDFNVNNESGPFISKKMLVDPIFDSHYVAFVLDGTYVGGGDHYEQIETKPHDDDASEKAEAAKSSEILKQGQVMGGLLNRITTTIFPSMPLYLPMEGDASFQVQDQIYISEGTLNSVIQTLHATSELALNLKVSSTFLKDNLFSNFEKVFGKNDSISVVLSTVLEGNGLPPAIQISKDNASTISAGDISLRVMNPFSDDDQGYEAAIIRGSASAKIDFEIVVDLNTDSKYELVVKLYDAVIEVSEVKTYFQCELGVSDF